MKRYLYLFLAIASLCSLFQSCEKEEEKDDDKDKVSVIVKWGVGKNVAFPDGCHVDEGYLEIGDEVFDLGQYDAILYGNNPKGGGLDLKCTINNRSGDAIADISLSNVGGSVLGPDGEGYANSYIYFRGGFVLFLSYSDAALDSKYHTSAIVNYKGIECTSEYVNIGGYIKNNREYRAKDSIELKYEDITEHLEYECDITIELEVDGKPLTLNITHISPL